MNHRVKYILFIILSLLWTACSHDAEERTQSIDVVPGLPEGAVGFGAVSRAGAAIAENEYLHNTFIDGESYLRIYNYIGNQLDFTDNAGYKRYVYDEHLSTLTGGQYNFRPLEGRGFIWGEVKAEGGSGYKFFAVAFPYFDKYRNEVFADQSKKENFGASDILMAYHSQSADGFGKKVSFVFWHVLSMLRVEVCVPVYDRATNTGFKEGGISDVVLSDLFTSFSFDSGQTPSSDKAPEVKPQTDDGASRADIKMFPLYDTEDNSNIVKRTEGGRECYVYPFAAILPVQAVTEKKVLLQLKLHTVDGQKKNFRYEPTSGTNISIAPGNITDLKLTIREDKNEAFLIKAQVKPWEEASTDMSLEKE